MKILIIEDSLKHQDSARQTLVGHDVTIIGSFKEAKKHLSTYGTFPYDVVMTDMNMPMNRDDLADGVWNPSELVPYGLILALRAAKCGAKYVAMVTDTNHHKNAMSNALDLISKPYFEAYEDSISPNFIINGAKCMFVHAPCLKGQDDPAKNGKDWGRVLKHLLQRKDEQGG